MLSPSPPEWPSGLSSTYCNDSMNSSRTAAGEAPLPPTPTPTASCLGVGAAPPAAPRGSRPRMRSYFVKPDWLFIFVSSEPWVRRCSPFFFSFLLLTHDQSSLFFFYFIAKEFWLVKKKERKLNFFFYEALSAPQNGAGPKRKRKFIFLFEIVLKMFEGVGGIPFLTTP